MTKLAANKIRRRSAAVALACIAIAITNALHGQQPAVQTHAVQRRRHVLAREEWQMNGRRIPGANSAALRNRAIQQKVLMRTAYAVSQAATGVSGAWVSIGPSPLPSDASGIGLQDYGWVTGRATAVAMDPNDPSGNTVYAGGAYGGVWKSSNAGALSPNPVSVNWTALTDNQATLAIGAIAIQPQLSIPDPTKSVVLAGTGETNSSADSYYGLGILRSPDGGQSWTLISGDVSGTHSFAGLGFSQMAFSSANPNLVVAAAAAASQGIVEGLENPAASNRGLYYSNDAGVSWQAASVSDGGTSTSPASITSVVYNSAAATFYAAIRFHGFYSSPDGINWSRLAFQPGSGLNTASCPPQTVLPSFCPIYRGEIAVVPNWPGSSGMGEMYVWDVDANDGDQGIWQSVDGGVSWNQINDSGISNCGDVFGGGGTVQGRYNLALAAVPNGTATDLYAGAENLYKCTITNAFPTCNGSGNNTFLNLAQVYGCSDIAKVHPDQHAMDFLAANGTALLYFANDGGIYRALDGFSGLRTGTCGQANQFDGLNSTLGPMTQFVSVSESASDANLMFGGTQDNGTPATAFSQSGGSWVNVNAGDDGFTAVNPAVCGSQLHRPPGPEFRFHTECDPAQRVRRRWESCALQPGRFADHGDLSQQRNVYLLYAPCADHLRFQSRASAAGERRLGCHDEGLHDGPDSALGQPCGTNFRDDLSNRGSILAGTTAVHWYAPVEETASNGYHIRALLECPCLCLLWQRPAGQRRQRERKPGNPDRHLQHNPNRDFRFRHPQHSDEPDRHSITLQPTVISSNFTRQVEMLFASEGLAVGVFHPKYGRKWRQTGCNLISQRAALQCWEPERWEASW